MGIKGLNKFWLKKSINSIQKTNLSKLQGKRVAIDFTLYLYKFLLTDHHYLKSLFYQILKLTKFGITPVYIFDGQAPKEKDKTIEGRRKKRTKLENKIIELENFLEKLEDYSQKNNINIDEIRKHLLKDINKMDKSVVYIRSEYIENSKKLLDLLKIPYLQAESEAEQYCSQLVNNGLVDYVISEDTDVFPCGASKVIKNLTFKDNYVYVYDYKLFLKELKLNEEQFLQMCILFGCDYLNRHIQIGEDKLYELVHSGKTYKDLYRIYKIGNDFTNYEKILYYYQEIRDTVIDDKTKEDIKKLLMDKKFTKQEYQKIYHFFIEHTKLQRHVIYDKINSYQRYMNRIYYSKDRKSRIIKL